MYRKRNLHQHSSSGGPFFFYFTLKSFACFKVHLNCAIHPVDMETEAVNSLLWATRWLTAFSWKTSPGAHQFGFFYRIFLCCYLILKLNYFSALSNFPPRLFFFKLKRKIQGDGFTCAKVHLRGKWLLAWCNKSVLHRRMTEQKSSCKTPINGANIPWSKRGWMA